MIKYCVKSITDTGNIFLYVAESKQKAIDFYDAMRLPNSMVISLLDYVIDSLDGKWYVERIE